MGTSYHYLPPAEFSYANTQLLECLSHIPRGAPILRIDIISDKRIGSPPTLAAKTAGIPTVVAFGVGDPVATGLVDSLARPGGTVTGISDNATTLSTKRLSLLKELLPKL